MLVDRLSNVYWVYTGVYWMYIGMCWVYIGVLWVYIGVCWVYIGVCWMYIGVCCWVYTGVCWVYTGVYTIALTLTHLSSSPTIPLFTESSRNGGMPRVSTGSCALQQIYALLICSEKCIPSLQIQFVQGHSTSAYLTESIIEYIVDRAFIAGVLDIFHSADLGEYTRGI